MMIHIFQTRKIHKVPLSRIKIQRMKKSGSPYEKTVAIWTTSKSEQVELKTIIEKLGYYAVICTSNKQVFNARCFAIIANGRKNIPKGFFWQLREKYETLFNMIESGEVTLMLFDKISYGTPDNVKQIKISDELGIESILKQCENSIEKFVGQRKAMEKQVGRLFYMFTELVKNKQLLMHDVMNKANVSRSTFYRDIKFMQKVSPWMEIKHGRPGSAFTLSED